MHRRIVRARHVQRIAVDNSTRSHVHFGGGFCVNNPTGFRNVASGARVPTHTHACMYTQLCVCIDVWDHGQDGDLEFYFSCIVCVRVFARSFGRSVVRFGLSLIGSRWPPLARADERWCKSVLVLRDIFPTLLALFLCRCRIRRLCVCVCVILNGRAARYLLRSKCRTFH